MISYEIHKDIILFGIPLGVWFFFHYIASWGMGTYYGVREGLRRKDININNILQMLLFAFIGALVGARVFAFFGPWASACASGSFLNRFMLMFSFQEQGWVAYGGMIGAFFFAYLCAKARRISFLKHVDVTIPSVAIGMSLARIGCFIAGCCFGSATNVPWAIIRAGEAIHPTQLYNSLTNLTIFIIVLYLNERREREDRFDGILFFSFLILYSVFRFFTEFLRGDYMISNYFYGLTSSQWISIAMLVVFVPVMIYKLGKDKPRKTGSKFHIRPKSYAIIIAGGLVLNIGAYISTPLPYLAAVMVFGGMGILFAGISSIFSPYKTITSKKTKN